MNKQNVIDFLKYLAWSSLVEINDLNHTLNFNDVLWRNNIYFCAWLDKKSQKRCSDDDIKKKRYFVVDLDIRLEYWKKNWKVLTQEELDKEIENILKILKDTGLNEYSYVVNSWNWIHLYYCWEEKNFDKQIYSDWVKRAYEQIDDVLQKTPYKCDPATSNLARITRLPWTYNPRKKEIKWEVIRDMWEYECKIIKEQKQDSILFDLLEDFAKKYREAKEEDKEKQIEVKRIVKKDYKKEDIWEKINQIPAGNIAEYVWGVSVVDRGLDNVALRENKKNMWAYWYKPYNIIVNTGSSLIKTDKSYFTSYELVYYELMNKDSKATIDFFRDRYWIEIKEQKKWIDMPKLEYEKIWYVYPNEVFDPFDCFMSGELVTIIAESNSWKTTFAMDIIKKNSELWKRWFYINLEFAIETMRQNRWLWLNNKKKRNLTDLDPLSAEDKTYMDNYVKKNLKTFDYYNNPKWLELEELVNLIIEKKNEWYWLIVIDTFSRIHWNLDQQKARTSQNKSMEILQELAQNLWVAIVLLHHTNRAGTFEGSQKIMDLSNVFIVMTKQEDAEWESYRTFSLSKDKYVTSTDIDVRYRNQTYFNM